MEEGQWNTHDALQTFLNVSQPGSAIVLDLIEDFILSKRICRDQMGAEMTKISKSKTNKGYEGSIFCYTSFLFYYFRLSIKF